MTPEDRSLETSSDAEAAVLRDGRQIDLARAELLGEGAHQIVETIGGARVPYEVWSQIPSVDDRRPTYYGRPVVKEPVWIWAVPLYFYVGGTAGAALVLGATAQVLKQDKLRDLIQACRWIGVLGCTAGTGLLIYDLGRPERFLNMLRIFRPTSPMSMGSWILALTGSLSGIAAFGSLRKGFIRKLADAASVASGLFGMPLAGYTGVLLCNTAIPVWQQASRSLPVLFMVSGAAALGSLLEAAHLSTTSARIAKRFAVIGETATLLMMWRVERDAEKLTQVAKPLHQGFSGFLWHTAGALGAAGLIFSIFSGKNKAAKITAAALGTAGAITLRFAVVHAGHQSARDPAATFQQQSGQVARE